MSWASLPPERRQTAIAIGGQSVAKAEEQTPTSAHDQAEIDRLTDLYGGSQ